MNKIYILKWGFSGHPIHPVTSVQDVHSSECPAKIRVAASSMSRVYCCVGTYMYKYINDSHLINTHTLFLLNTVDISRLVQKKQQQFISAPIPELGCVLPRAELPARYSFLCAYQIKRLSVYNQAMNMLILFMSTLIMFVYAK